MKKLLRSLLCILLVLSMTVVATLQAIAAEGQEYISEIKMAICDSLDDAKKELSGYTVLESSLSKGQGNGAQSVYLGYKTTKDKSKAITDLRLMDMNGGYSYCDYEKALEEQLEVIQDEINSFSDAVKEFQKNYKAGTKNAVFAYNEMNRYKDDDQNVLIGDLFIDESVSVDKLQTIFLEGNGSVILAIEELLAVGCSDNWLERLVQNGKKVYDASAFTLEQYCEPIRAQWETLYKGLTDYESQLEDEYGFDLADSTEESFREWTEDENTTDSLKNVVINYGPAYVALENIDYKGGTLLDYFMVPLNEVDYEYLYPIADAMTKGQIQTMKYIGLTKALCYSNVDMSLFSETLKENEARIQQIAVEVANENIEDESEKLTVPEAGAVISVYSGVDRSLFEQGSGVALTNDAIRQSNSSDDAPVVAQMLKNAKTGLIITSVICTAAIVGASIAFKLTAPTLGPIIETFGDFFVMDYTNAHMLTYISPLQKTAHYCFGTLLGIAIGTLVIVTGVLLYKGYKKYMNPDYKVVPRAIVDQKIDKVYDSYGNEVDEKKFYYAYYAVEDAKPDGEHGNYADMNAWKAQQWNVMYYTKDKRAGQPILANTFVVQYGDSKRPSGYTSFAEFGLSAAADINKHAFDDAQGIYLFYKTAEPQTASTGLGSMFVNGYYAIASLLGLAVGVGATIGIGAVVIKKKRKKSLPVEA